MSLYIENNIDNKTNCLTYQIFIWRYHDLLKNALHFVIHPSLAIEMF